MRLRFTLKFTYTHSIPEDDLSASDYWWLYERTMVRWNVANDAESKEDKKLRDDEYKQNVKI